MDKTETEMKRREDERRIFEEGIMSIILISFVGILILLLILAINSATIKHIETEQVKCIDERGREFVDELCNKEIYCSWLGLCIALICFIMLNPLKNQNDRNFL